MLAVIVVIRMTSIADGRHTSTARGTTSASRIGGIVGTSGDGLGCEFPFQSRINSAQLGATGYIDCRRSALKFEATPLSAPKNNALSRTSAQRNPPDMRRQPIAQYKT